jgi:hypothetical protein
LANTGVNNFTGEVYINAGTLEFDNGGAAGSISTADGATFELFNGNLTVGAIANLGTTLIDANAALMAGDITSDGEITVGPNAVMTAGDITGAGSMTLNAGAMLNVASMAQNTLTIGPGAKLTITPLPGGPVSALLSLQPVSEPSIWAMLLPAVLGFGVYRRTSLSVSFSQSIIFPL